MIHINNFYSIEKKLIKYFFIKTKLTVVKNTKKGFEKKHAYQYPSEKKEQSQKTAPERYQIFTEEKKGKRHKKIFLRNERISKLSIEEIII